MSKQIPPPIPKLIDKYFNGSATPTELDELDRWYESVNAETVEVTVNENPETLNKRIKSKLMQQVAMSGEQTSPQQRVRKSVVPRSFVRSAAAVALLFGAAYFLGTALQDQATDTSEIRHFTETEDVAPPAPNAYLIRQDHSVLDLGRILAGEITTADAQWSEKDGKISFATDPTHVNSPHPDLPNPVEHLEVVVPKGNLFEMVLPDGSRVSLNADSRLTFPNRFEGRERHVTLSGEGFFEVVADPERPFFVHTEKQEIRVTGTRFNVSAYDNEQTESTALVDGKVSLKNRTDDRWVNLTPGELGVVQHHNTQVKSYGSLEGVIAWKSHVFVFEEESLASILRKISRWYNVDVDWSGIDIQDHLFSGKIRKQAGLKEVLTMIGMVADIDFHQRHNRLVVTKRNTK